MLECPKGYKYWNKNDTGITISADAPQWAKKEFHKYMKLFAKNGKPDKHGIIKYY
ncbi:hypothetical protein [Lactobacillus melliventris]|uniref:Uncharacterized protein n=1 Tax=Lactobacillus melliventris TaxID=1218507 RepID=A0A0F4LGM3_9LACO|nr:hypothetical protein [Lactobacillus melliventris]KJY56721.1 uncharacterized protein JF74_10730 [Lactobacillus melliventris]